MIDQLVRACVHPDNGIVKRCAGLPVPQQRCFALIGDADGCNIGSRELRFLQCFADNMLRVAPDFIGIVLNPASLGIDLLVFALIHGDNIAVPVKNDKT